MHGESVEQAKYQDCHEMPVKYRIWLKFQDGDFDFVQNIS